jgi:hypothetical protein
MNVNKRGVLSINLSIDDYNILLIILTKLNIEQEQQQESPL